MSAGPISFEISDVQSGWACINVRAGEASYRIDGFSYTTDAFDDLVRFGIDALLRAPTAEVMLDGEPEGWLLSFTRHWGSSRLALAGTFRVHEIESVIETNAERREVFAAEVAGDQIGSAVEMAVSRLEADMGIEAFESAWGQAYPVRGMAALKAALGQRPRPKPEMEF